ncbi:MULTISPECIES: helix-turn-helix domain-containing protein [Alphaproteobacteria]|uniref:Transcriptional regulator n=2 Tax=Alphaproteobacteria TaxID=28211 RepID=A0A512HEN8_9HYPH|nr:MULTISPECIES: helix-turn-helix domain-containing protein [Alphaproteobacteria]GEO83925.1 transcriptional regulator [Ciceribacter naphthalenivorans]GLR21197.1 transcriptional regulator [Ciceribacter naphthalenivorans]GLT04053.1 transcriptional regulator [Sphingomonas psychrolutea]
MRQQNSHSDLVYTTALQNSAAASSPIAASWRRCINLHQLAPEEGRKPFQVDDTVFRMARERMEQLILACSDEVDRLYQTVGRSGCCIVLSDRDGILLDRRAAAGDEADFHGLGLRPQNVWSEASVGTNGIGTALADERSVIIHRDQHFLSSNIELSCATAPIRDHMGRVTAALDISTCRTDVTDMTLAILSQAVRDVATRVEATLFRQAFPGARIVMVPTAQVATAALIAVDYDDLILGATKAARAALKLDDTRIAQGVPAADALRESRGEVGSDLSDAERAALRRALTRANGNVSQAAQILGISRATLHRKIKRFSLQ